LADTAVTAAAYGSASQVGTFTVDAQGRLTAAANQLIAINPYQILQNGANTGEVLKWNGSAWVASADSDNGITALTGDVTAVGPGSAAATIANDKITTNKLKSTGGGINRLLMTDPTTGSSVVFADTCGVGEVLKWQGASGWACSTDIGGAGFVTYVGTTSDLTGGPISTTGTLGVNTGTGANQILKLNGTAQIPAVDGSLLTFVNAVKLQGNAVSAAAPTPGFVLGWNGSQWEPVAVAGGDITDVQTGTGLTGGFSTGNGTIRLADTAVTPNSYGAAATVGTFTVDQQGRLTSATNVTIAIPTTALLATGASTNDILKWNGSAWVPGSDSGIVTVTAGTGLAGGGTGSNVTIRLNDTAVTANSYGSASQVATFTVDQQGRLTAAGNTSILINGNQINQSGATNGQVLAWNGSAWAPTAASAGDITDVQTGTGLTGGFSSGNGTIKMADTAVTPGAYGSASQVATYTVDQQGRLTVAGQTAIAINPNQINQVGATSGQVLAWNGSAWVPTSGAVGSLTYIGTTSDLTGGPISTTGTLGINTGTGANQILKLNGTAQIPAVDGSLLTQVNAVKLQGNAVSATAPTSGYALKWNGSQWEPQADTGGVASITAGTGLLGGTISTVGTISVNVGIGANQIPQLNGSGYLGIGTATVTTGAVADFYGATNLDSAVILPRATTANRPAGSNGMIRYNTSLAKFEVYENGNWYNMATGAVGSGDFMADGSVPMTGTFKAVGGNNAAPSITYGSDQSTGAYFFAGTMGFSTAGTERFRINNLGMGIGVTPVTSGYSLQTNRGIYSTGTTHTFGTGSSNTTSSTVNIARDVAGASSMLSFTNGAAAAAGVGTRINFTAYDDATNPVANYIEMATTNPVAANYTNRFTFQMRDNGGGVPGFTVYGARAVVGSTVPTNGAGLEVIGTGSYASSILIPRDITANRPTGVNGMIRYNTTTQKFEVYEGVWQNMISAQASGADNLGNHTATSSIVGVVGSQTGPAYTFSGDTDTGNWHPAANTYAISTGGSERVRIDNLGFVGIGTTSPIAKLHLDASGGDGFRIMNTHNGAGDYITLVDGGNSAYINMDSSGQLEFRGTGLGFYNSINNPIVTVLDGGAVGIGTSSPSAVFDVFATGAGAVSAILVPRDTTAFRPTGVNGMIRYNTTSLKFEVYEGRWQNMISAGGAGDNLGNHTAT
jgi:hypothetical protein